MHIRDYMLINTFLGLGRIPKIYCIWAVLSISLAIVAGGFSSESVTRILVIMFLLGQLFFCDKATILLTSISPKRRFILIGMLLATVVEGFHMISRPVFMNVRIGWETSFAQGFKFLAIDLAFTLPAYYVIYSVIWFFINRFQYSLWSYILIFGFAQAMGDGGIFFFINAPPMLLFLPYPMTNYHAINILPFLAVRNQLSSDRSGSYYSYLAIPAVMSTYFVCGAIIKLLGKSLGFE